MLGKAEVKQFFDTLADEEGFLAVKDLGVIVNKVGMPTDPRSLVSIQGALRELYIEGRIEEGIPFELFYHWYKLEASVAHYDNHNQLLVRPVIGRVRHPTRNLKDGAFIYGQKNIPDKEGAGTVVLNWVAGSRSQSKEAGVSLMKVNKAAISNKCLTSKAVNEFLRENRDSKHLQRPKVIGKKKQRGPKVEYAEPMTNADRRKEETDMRDIIFPGGEDFSDPAYADVSGQVKKGRLPKPRGTNGSALLVTHTRNVKSSQEPKEQWKMSKFTKQAKAKVVI